MADNNITQEELNALFSSVASIEDSDKAHFTTAEGQCIMVQAELLKAYLQKGSEGNPNVRAMSEEEYQDRKEKGQLDEHTLYATWED